MISSATLKYARISPRKVRYVIDLIRKKPVKEAEAILIGSPRRAGEIIHKLLNQAVDAAQKNSQADKHNLFVSCVMADGGPTMRRFRAATMGRASIIRKRTSHIYLELEEIRKGITPAPSAKAKKPAVKAAAVSAATKSAKKPATKKLVGAK